MARPLAAALLLAGLAVGTGARAEALRDFCADRPGKATPACILDAGHLQIETGIVDSSLQRGGGERDDVHAVGQTEIRFGVSPRTELGLLWTPLSVERGHDAAGRIHRQGIGDLQLGFRTAVTDPDRAARDIALEGFVTAPTAGDGQGAGGWEGGARLPMALQLASGFGFEVVPGADLRRGGHLALSTVVALSHDVGPASVVAELWAEREDLAGGHEDHASFDLSAAWMVGPNLQLDVGANAGLTRTTPDIELYVGVARRF